ncbi:MAG TPA: cadherin-like domain-containing protein, partial [Symbiobacteriaceae bacterium]|nr:cadherin-like domain-containing protein [Symbiobacteriaceae bacterium]
MTSLKASRKWVKTLLAVMAGVVLLWPSDALAAGTLDQQQTQAVDMDVNADGNFPVAQTFMPGVTGTLNSVSTVSYKMCASGCDGRTVIIQIKQGPPGGSGAILATAQNVITSGASVNTWYDYPFASPPLLYKDTVYSIIVTGPVSGGTSPNTGVGYVWWGNDGSPVDPYTRGSMWTKGSGTWLEWTGPDASELAFKTYMTPAVPPTVSTNAGLTLDEGVEATIASARLTATDTDTAASSVTFTVGTAPANGQLLKNSVALSGGGTFTQDDINNNRIAYRHNGSETTSDSFTFTVSDGISSTTSNTFNITVSPVNDPPVLAG